MHMHMHINVFRS